MHLKFGVGLASRPDGNQVYDAAFVAESRPDGTPWANLNRAQAVAECQALGAGYDLISNAQWQTIARNLEFVGWNWSGGTVGSSGGMSRGHSDQLPDNSLASSADANGACTGTGQACDLSTWSDQRRVHQLASGIYIWDISGNVSEVMKDENNTNFGANGYLSVITPTNRPTTGTISGVVGNVNYHFGPAGDYSALSTSPFAGLGWAEINYNNGAIARGLSWFWNAATGVFAVALSVDANFTGPRMGFRCVWTP